MDRLIEEVATQPLGAKWQQLYKRLGLEPRQRFKITVEHKQKGETEKVRCCVLDTIALWRQSEAVVKKNEREMMTLLLTALRNVQGFENAALRLSEKHGIQLVEENPAPSCAAKPPKPPGSGSSSTATKRKDKTVTSSHYTIEALDPHNDADLDSASTLVATGPSVMEQVEVESGSSFSGHLESLSEREGSSTQLRQEMLQLPIDMRNKVHKFAILDVVQRISLRHWNTICSRLELSRETIHEIQREESTEEKYYNAIKEWLKVKREEATFAVLNDLLEQCRQHGAQIVMRKRLECNRDLLEETR